MGAHYGIIADFLNSKNDPANFDVGTSQPGTNVRYTVFQPYGNHVQVVPFNNGFATSPDLFNLGGANTSPALVLAESVDALGQPDRIGTTALIRQKKLVLPTPQTSVGSLGTSFLFPLGDLGNPSGGGSGAHLLIGNPSNAQADGALSINGVAQPGLGVEAGGVQNILLSTAPALVVLIMNAPVVVALAIVGKGQEFAMTLIPPA
jgi:hypothetical protein